MNNKLDIQRNASFGQMQKNVTYCENIVGITRETSLFASFMSFDAANTHADLTLSENDTVVSYAGGSSSIRHAYFKDMPTDGIYAFELNFPALSSLGVTLTNVQDTTMFILDPPCRWVYLEDDIYSNAGTDTNTAILCSTANWFPVVFNFVDRKVHVPNPTRTAMTTNGNFLAGYTMYGSVVTSNASALDITLNSGESGTWNSADFESLISALETTLGKSITRGIGV